MGCVAEQNQAAGAPAPTVDPADRIHQQVVERRHPLQQVCCGGTYRRRSLQLFGSLDDNALIEGTTDGLKSRGASSQ
jgi:hypothetical protein